MYPKISCNKSGDFQSKSGDREIVIILSKIRRSPDKSGDLEALEISPNGLNKFMQNMKYCYVRNKQYYIINIIINIKQYYYYKNKSIINLL